MILLIISLYAIILRLLPILTNNFTFMFDHAKDALVIREMAVHFKPALIGPTTSIPGVFYGPFWYYLALPFNIIGKFHPFSSVVLILLLSGLNTYLMGKYFGKLPALLYAVSAGLIGTQQSAWTPYMTNFLTLPCLILLTNIYKQKKATTGQLMLLSALISLYFHFQPAFGIVFLPLVVLIIFLLKPKIKLKQLVLALFAFTLFFLPFFVFELRHNFHQTKALVSFSANYQKQSFHISPNQQNIIKRMQEIGLNLINNAQNSILPLSPPSPFDLLIKVAITAIIALYFWKSKNKQDSKIVLPILIGTFIIYLKFPFKTYYLSALFPVWIYIFSKALNYFQPKFKKVFLIIFIVAGLIHCNQQIKNYQNLAKTQSFLLNPQLKAVKLIYQLSERKPFSSYHFVPEIYDYTYQHIYLYLSDQGYQLPIEFSYAPEEVSYIPQKHLKASDAKPEYIFLITHPYDPVNKTLYDLWWGRVAKNIKILKKYKINKSIYVYQGKYL